jgi:hypothetical protein
LLVNGRFRIQIWNRNRTRYTNNDGSGSGRPKNLRIRIHNTGDKISKVYTSSRIFSMVKKSPKVASPKVKKDLADQSLEDFVDNWDEDDSADDLPVSKEKITKTKKEKKVKKPEKKKADDPGGKQKKEKAVPVAAEVKAQTKYIQTLKDKDPEFYEFLKENDEDLLNFDESDDDDDDDEERAQQSPEEGAHQLPERLEVASDESDYEEEEDEGEETEGPQKTAGGKCLPVICGMCFLIFSPNTFVL